MHSHALSSPFDRGFSLRAHRLDSPPQRLLDNLSSDEDKQRRRLGELTRKVTVLRVNEKSLSRRYTAMQEVEAALRRENKKLRNDVVAMETAVTERIGYLQRHKVRGRLGNEGW